MKKRVVLALVTGAAAALLVPLAAQASVAPEQPSAACVVAHVGGLTLQVGYAPDGPSSCTTIS